MRKLLLIILVLLSSYIAADAFSGFEFESVKYEPEKIQTGDHVFCRIKLAGKKLTPEDAEKIRAEKHISFELTDIKLNISSNEILIWFIPFNPSEKYLPAVKGSSFIIDNIPVEITGYAGPGDTAPEPPGAVLLPGTRLFFGFVFFLIILFFFLIYCFTRYFYKPVKGGISGFLREMEIRKILSEIRSMKTDHSADDPEQFFSRLSRLFSRYLEKRLNSPYKPLTSSEITDSLSASGILSDSMAELLRKALFCSDRARFGKTDISLKACFSESVEAVVVTVEEVEKYKNSRQDEKNRSDKTERGGEDAV